MLIKIYHALSVVIVDTEQDENKYNLIFILGDGVSSRTLFCNLFSGFIHAHAIFVLNNDEIIYVSLE